MDIENVLEHFGLTKTEATIYLTLLEIGPSLAGVISRKSGIHRRSIYDATDRLIKKGLIGYISNNNRRYFAATHPERLLELLKEREAIVQEVLPELTHKYLQQQEKQETVFYRGKNGLKTVFEDQLQVGKEVLVLGASIHAEEHLSYYLHWYTKRRVKQRMKLRLIYNTRIKGHAKKIPMASVKYLPIAYENYTATNIYGDRVAIIFWGATPFVILIKNKEIAAGYKAYFEHLWKIAKP